MPRSGDDESWVHSGSFEAVPLDLEAAARDCAEATCHVCDAPATVIAVRTDEQGGAVVLCDEDHRLATDGDAASLARRLAATYGEPESDTTRLTALLTTGLGRHVRIVR